MQKTVKRNVKKHIKNNNNDFYFTDVVFLLCIAAFVLFAVFYIFDD